jgi:hypothetical protein
VEAEVRVTFLKLKVNDAKLRAAMKAAPKATRKYLADQLRSEGRDWERSMDDRFGGYSRARSTVLGVRTGRLRGSLHSEVTDTGTGPITLSVYSAGVPYALSQEFGAVILPRNVRYLTVPLPDNLTPSGVARFPSARALMGEVDEHGKRRTFVHKSKAGNLVIGRHAPGGKTEWLWMLRDRTVLPCPDTTGDRSRLGFFDTWDQLEPDREVGREAALKLAVAAAFGGTKR